MRKTRTLQAWEEIVGRLEEAAETANGAIVNIAGVQCFLPNFSAELHADLLKLIGTNIGILRLTNGYRIRVLKRGSISRTASARPYVLSRLKRCLEG